MHDVKVLISIAGSVAARALLADTMARHAPDEQEMSHYYMGQVAESMANMIVALQREVLADDYQGSDGDFDAPLLVFGNSPTNPLMTIHSTARMRDDWRERMDEFGGQADSQLEEDGISFEEDAPNINEEDIYVLAYRIENWSPDRFLQ